jgi:hypothetical protein
VIENYEPIAWAEELIEPARAVDHPRLAFLYVVASLCYLAGRVEAAVGYCDAGQTVLGRDGGEVPFGTEGFLGGAYLAIGQPRRWAELCRTQLARGRDTHAFTRASLVIALTLDGYGDESVATATGVIDAAEATGNPYALSYALLAYGLAFCETDSVRARDALRLGLMISQESGTRANQSFLAQVLARLEAEHGDPLAALDHVTVAIRNFHDSGNTAVIRSPMAILAAFLDRLERYEAAAIIGGFAVSPLTAVGSPEIGTTIAHLRDVLGDSAYESLAHKGETMTTAAMVTYAYDQIDQARTTLEHPS